MEVPLCRVKSIVTACMILHNLCMDARCNDHGGRAQTATTAAGTVAQEEAAKQVRSLRGALSEAKDADEAAAKTDGEA